MSGDYVKVWAKQIIDLHPFVSSIVVILLSLLHKLSLSRQPEKGGFVVLRTLDAIRIQVFFLNRTALGYERRTR